MKNYYRLLGSKKGQEENIMTAQFYFMSFFGKKICIRNVQVEMIQ